MQQADDGGHPCRLVRPDLLCHAANPGEDGGIPGNYHADHADYADHALHAGHARTTRHASECPYTHASLCPSAIGQPRPNEYLPIELRQRNTRHCLYKRE